MKSLSPSPGSTHQALTEWLIFGAVVIGLTLPFWLSDLDIQAASYFYHPEHPENVWPDENQGLWVFFYKAIPISVNILLLGSLVVMAWSGSRPNAKRIRRMALFVLFSILLGPGLVVNGIFKDHYGRPRPRQIEQFQGHLVYQPPGMPGAEGKSFPCGHCSVGFAVWIFYFLNRRRKPLLAYGILVFAISLGIAVGLGRMAAGGHFLSDILWSGFFSYAVCALLYHPLVGKWEDTPDEQVPEFALLARWQSLSKPMQKGLFIGLAVLLAVVASLATPRKTKTEMDIPLTALNPQQPLQIDAKVGDVLLKRSTKPTGQIHARLSFKGFGFPTSRIEETFDPQNRQFIVAKNGLFTDIEGQLELTIPSGYHDALNVKAENGRIFLAPVKPEQWKLDAAKGVIIESAIEKRFR